MKVLITGASGYLGARLASYLAHKNQKNELILASRSGNCPWLQGLGKQIALDLERSETLDLPSEIDVIVHLAAINEKDCAATARAVKVNVEGSWNLIESAIKHDIKRFVYASTIHVYGPLQGQLTESTIPISRHPYGFTHYMAEQLFEYAAYKYETSSTCLRFSNIVGAPANRQVNRWTLLINDLCRQAVQTQRLLIRSPESQRDFIAMSDACVAVEKAMTERHVPHAFDVFNISMGVNARVKDIAALVAHRATKLFGKEIVVVTNETSLEDSGEDFQIDNSKAKNWGWSPQSEFQGEIDQTLRLCMEG